MKNEESFVTQISQISQMTFIFDHGFTRIDTDFSSIKPPSKVCKEKGIFTKSFTTTGDVLAVVRTATEAVCGVFAVWACNDAMVIVGLPKYTIIENGIVAVPMIMTE